MSDEDADSRIGAAAAAEGSDDGGVPAGVPYASILAGDESDDESVAAAPEDGDAGLEAAEKQGDGDYSNEEVLSDE